MKKLFSVIFFLIIISFAKHSFAEEFALTKIGTLSVTKPYYSHWWFSESRPTLRGTGSRGANIDITIDSVFKTVKAGIDDGYWEFTPETPLEKNDHTVVVASGTDQISFILTIGSDMPADAKTKGGVSELPQTGNLLPTVIVIALAGGFLYLGFRGKVI